MSILTFFKQSILFLALCMIIIVAPGEAQEKKPIEKWKRWIGKSINVSYDCCGAGSCTMIRGAKLIDINNKIIIISSKGHQYLIPSYIITMLELSK